MSDVLYTYLKEGSGEFLIGVPARDITLFDWDQMEPWAKDVLRANSDYRGRQLYAQVSKVNEVRKEAKAPAEKKSHGKKRIQPDTDVSGRTDADVVGTGEAVPPADEPVGGGVPVPGFIQADSGGSAASKEG